MSGDIDDRLIDYAWEYKKDVGDFEGWIKEKKRLLVDEYGWVPEAAEGIPEQDCRELCYEEGLTPKEALNEATAHWEP